MASISETLSENTVATADQNEASSSLTPANPMDELFSDSFGKKLESLATENAEAYKKNNPFPHIYFDDFLPCESRSGA